MLQSMTGYGKAEIALSDKKITIEIKSLNSKNIDSNIKLPHFYREKEILIRKLLQEKLVRGKIDFSIYYEQNEGKATSSINKEVVKAYYEQIKELKQELDLNSENVLSALLKLPDAIKTDKIELDEEEWTRVETGIHEAIADLIHFREQEGEALKTDLSYRTDMIVELLQSIKPFEKDRIKKLRDRIARNLEEINSNDASESNRFEQEMIYYLEKLDISEEKTRLENHCRYFHETLDSENERGKKLAFISQEMGREINTLGSKANESHIQHTVVRMKDELEKIKEQLLNVL